MMEELFTFAWRLLVGLSLVFSNLGVMALYERVREHEEGAE